MRPSHRSTRLFDWLWFLAWALASSVWCVMAAHELGATFDEPVYVQRGLDVWRTGSHRGLMKLGTMPLPVDVETLPLYVWERWQGSRFDAVKDLGRLLPVARAGTLVFWWLLLGYGWRAGRQLAGPWGGRLAVAMLASEPSFLAHASLATTDIAISACLLAFVYHFRTGRQGGWFPRLAVPGFWFGAAVLAKASGLVFGPLCMLAVELERIVRAGEATDHEAGSAARWFRHGLGKLWAVRRDFVWIFAGGLALAFVCCGSDWQVEPSFIAWAHHLPQGRAAGAMSWLAEHLCIFSNAGEGLTRQVGHNVRGHGAFLLGHQDPRALWYYFPLLMTIKLSVPLLLTPLVLLALRPRVLVNWACVAAAGLVLFSLTCRVQIGVRLMLPLIALAVVGLSAAIVHACQGNQGAWRKQVLTWGAAAGVGWTAAAALIVWPDALCYANELWGGTARGYEKISEANYDWGQGLKELARWQRQHGLDKLDVWYFGTDPAITSRSLRPVAFQSLAIRKANDVVRQERGRYLAVSTTLLYGAFDATESHRVAAAFLRTRTPAGRTPTFLIYNFRETGAGDQTPSRQ